MLTPKHFKISNHDEIFTFIEANAFGELISTTNGMLHATPMPFLLSENKHTLWGHLAKVNPQHEHIEEQEVLLCFQGAHGYISPSWYTSAGVPTWNYQAAHVYGQAKRITDANHTKTQLEAITNKYEQAFETPWQVNYPPTMLDAIVGIEITINRIECKYKLSQNRPKEDINRIIENLDTLGNHTLSKAMIDTKG